MFIWQRHREKYNLCTFILWLGQVWCFTEATEAIVSVAPGLYLAAHWNVPIENLQIPHRGALYQRKIALPLQVWSIRPAREILGENRNHLWRNRITFSPILFELFCHWLYISETLISESFWSTHLCNKLKKELKMSYDGQFKGCELTTLKNPGKRVAGLGLALVSRTKPPEPPGCLILEDLQTSPHPHKQETRGFGHNTGYFFLPSVDTSSLFKKILRQRKIVKKSWNQEKFWEIIGLKYRVSHFERINYAPKVTIIK